MPLLKLIQDEPPEHTFLTAEHFMMYHKAVLFGDLGIAKLMLDEPEPNHVRSLGRQVSGFDEDTWQMKRYDIVLQGNFARFRSSNEMRDLLMATGDKILVEASPYDKSVVLAIGPRLVS